MKFFIFIWITYIIEKSINEIENEFLIIKIVIDIFILMKNLYFDEIHIKLDINKITFNSKNKI